MMSNLGNIRTGEDHLTRENLRLTVTTISLLEDQLQWRVSCEECLLCQAYAFHLENQDFHYLHLDS